MNTTKRHSIELQCEFRTPKRPQSLTILPGGPHGFSRPALIPQALVIDGRRPSWADAPMLQPGESISLAMWGHWKVVDYPHSGDWYRLVPMQGPRYYPDYDGDFQWSIRDREDDGKLVARASSRDDAIAKATQMSETLTTS